MSINDSIETIERILNEISRVNNEAIKQTDNLRMVLVNLQIEDAHIEGNTGIVPIAQEIEKVINAIHNNTDKLVKDGRKELRSAFNDVKEYVKITQGGESDETSNDVK
jgi:ribosome-associated translation inhibitor RaiA